MRVTMQRLDKLIPYAGNAKAHPQDQVEKIAASIEEFGFLVPLVIDSGNVIVAGHGRFEAAKHLGMDVDEILRLKQITGLAEAFANQEFSRSWEEYSDARN